MKEFYITGGREAHSLHVKHSETEIIVNGVPMDQYSFLKLCDVDSSDPRHALGTPFMRFQHDDTSVLVTIEVSDYHNRNLKERQIALTAIKSGCMTRRVRFSHDSLMSALDLITKK